jgi:hypothetical protein
LLLAGQIATCGIVDLELLFSATSPDFERIAAITAQPVRWVLPRGSVS